jgi:putative transposase
LQEASIKYQNKEVVTFVTDGSVENTNTTVKDFLATTGHDIKHLIAQKDITFSNSKIKAFNEITKHQFLLSLNLENRKQLINALPNDVSVYNNVRPQLSLQGNTPVETFSGNPITINAYKAHFHEQKTLRVAKNKKINAKIISCKAKKIEIQYQLLQYQSFFF